MIYQEILNKINTAKTAYYQTGRSDLTDQEYDLLVEQAERLGYVETVGAAPVDNIKKITHEHPMLSLDKCHSSAEVFKFMNNHDVLAMEKADGLTVSATYIDGILTRLETRGNGTVGNDIMFHANSIENLPKYIEQMGKYVIDGECVILYSDFEKINEKMIPTERYSHPRNLAAGSLNQLDPSVSKRRHLRFYAWDVIECGEYNSLATNLAYAEKLGFDTVNFDYINAASDDCGSLINNAITHIRDEAELNSMPIDGVVFKYNDIKYGKSLGMTGHHPKLAIAFKYKDDVYPTKLRSITWQVGKTAQITPVANFDPIDMDGVVVEKSSLHNISIIKQLGLTNGCTCYVKRSNDVIPQIESIDNDGDGDIEIPVTCPECGSPTRIVKDNNSEVLYCTNDNCPGKLLGIWKTFVSKKGMDVDGLSEATLERFLRLGYLTNMFISLYELKDYKKELYKLDGFGKRSIDNLLAAIEASKSVDLQHFITAFSIPSIGEGQSKLLVAKFKTFEEFSKACDDQYDFSKIPGIGPVLSRSINQWWMLNHMQMMDIAQIVEFQSDDIMNQPEGDLIFAGKTFVVTGSVHHFKNRSELQHKIESLGGKVGSSVSKNTDYLINNDVESTSGKNKKAKELNVPIISEENFLDMIEINN